jgi:hypothetical protein
MDSNSPPVSMRSAPKRRAKMSRTAGTKEVPPVRKTRSTPFASSPAWAIA